MEVHAATIMINGTVGAGKTTAASALALLLEEAGVAHAVVDPDEIRRSWPAPAGDRFNLELQLANLTALSTNYRAAGADVLVVSGVVESADALERYKAAAGGQPMVVARLTADHDTRALRIAPVTPTTPQEPRGTCGEPLSLRRSSVKPGSKISSSTPPAAIHTPPPRRSGRNRQHFCPPWKRLAALARQGHAGVGLTIRAAEASGYFSQVS